MLRTSTEGLVTNGIVQCAGASSIRTDATTQAKLGNTLNVTHYRVWSPTAANGEFHGNAATQTHFTSDSTNAIVDPTLNEFGYPSPALIP